MPPSLARTSPATSLPHQLTAVYEHMLPRQPLRFVLADDPGTDRLFTVGLTIQQLLRRGDVRRVLIVAPGSRVARWRDTLLAHFDLDFRAHRHDPAAPPPRGDAFVADDRLIVRLDQATHHPAFAKPLRRAGWDLVVFDEAHKLEVHCPGSFSLPSYRFLFAESLSRQTRHILLLTPTPHPGKEVAFDTFLSSTPSSGSSTRTASTPTARTMTTRGKTRRTTRRTTARTPSTRSSPPWSPKPRATGRQDSRKGRPKGRPLGNDTIGHSA